jgi:hypothetical protein
MQKLMQSQLQQNQLRNNSYLVSFADIAGNCNAEKPALRKSGGFFVARYT